MQMFLGKWISIDLAQARVQLQAFVVAVMNYGVQQYKHILEEVSIVEEF
jgi:hypothetical protein